MITIKPNPLPPFRPLYRLPPKTWLVICIGGRGGAKSYEVSKFTTLQAITNNKRCAALRDEQSTISQSILHEIKLRFEEINRKAFNYFSFYFEMQNNGLKNLQTNTMQIFTKGFRSTNTAKKAGLKSIADVDIAVVEEFEDISDEEKFNTFADSIRKDEALIIINSNVPSKNHWFVKRYFTLTDVTFEDARTKEITTYYQLGPKNIPGVVYIFSSFEDNPFLSETTVARYKMYGNPESPLYNLEHYCTDILGLVSEGAKGRIYRGWKIITEAEYDALPYPETFGLDFGYSNDPVALIGIKSHNNKSWCREKIYAPGLTNTMLAKRMTALGIRRQEIIADSAEPKSIAELNDMGFNVVPATKGPDSLLAGIKFLQGREMHMTENSTNIQFENQEYKWQLDADKNPTDAAVDKNNHAKDAIRYNIFTKHYRGESYGFKKRN